MTPASVAAATTVTTTAIDLNNALIASFRAVSLHSCCSRVARIKCPGLSWGQS